MKQKFVGCWREVCKGKAVNDVHVCSCCWMKNQPLCLFISSGYKKGMMEIRFKETKGRVV